MFKIEQYDHLFSVRTLLFCQFIKRFNLFDFYFSDKKMTDFMQNIRVKDLEFFEDCSLFHHV